VNQQREIAGLTAIFRFYSVTLYSNIPPTQPVFSSLRSVLSPLRMLALPLYPSSIGPHQSPESVPQYRPAKDIESFNKLLPPAVEFVEGSSSGTLLIAEGRYEPVNGSPKAASASEVRIRHIIFLLSHSWLSSKYLPKRYARIPVLRQGPPMSTNIPPLCLLAR
jgi:hypothetical protein